MINRFYLPILFLGFFSTSVFADIKDDLYGENEAHKTYFDSFIMNCSQRTPQCIEREAASIKEESFNQIFINALDRDMQDWPNNELSKLRLALQTRENADSDFASGFFGNAAELYQDAFDQIAKLIEEADIIVNENISIGEEYLYDENRPDWAVDYFNEALIYDPTNPKIIKALSRIRFLQSFDDDVDLIESMIETESFEDAEGLIDELLQGDPGNKTLLALKKTANEGELGIKINNTLLDFQDQQALSNTEAQKEKLLSKIANSLSLYGYNDMTKGIQELQDILKEDLFNQRFNSLESNFINDSLPAEEMYKKSQKLLNQYPRKQQVINLSEQIKQKRNLAILDTLKKQASTYLLEENWKDAANTYSEVYLITNEEADKELFDSTSTLIKRLSSLKQITNEPTISLNTQSKVDSARWLLKELKNFSNTDSPNLNASIIDFEQLIDSYQMLITEDLNRKRSNNKVVTNSSNSKNVNPNITTKNSIAQQNQSSNTGKRQEYSSEVAISNRDTELPKPSKASKGSISSAKLDMASFISNIVCAKKTRNKEMSTQFEITVLSSGSASNVKLLNADDLKLNTRDKQTIDVIIDALKRANYTAAKSGGVAVTSTMIQKLAVPRGFCS